MANKKIVRRLTVTGKTGSYYVVLPKEMVKWLNWKKGEKKIVRQEGERIIIEDWEKQKRSSETFG